MHAREGVSVVDGEGHLLNQFFLSWSAISSMKGNCKGNMTFSVNVLYKVVRFQTTFSAAVGEFFLGGERTCQGPHQIYGNTFEKKRRNGEDSRGYDDEDVEDAESVRSMTLGREGTWEGNNFY